MPNLFDIDDLDPDDWDRVLALALDTPPPRRLAGQGVALLFEKPSARTRNSTEMAVVDLGGHPVYIQGAEVGLDDAGDRRGRRPHARRATTGSCAPACSTTPCSCGWPPRSSAAASTSPWSTSSPTPRIPARPWPTCSPCARRWARSAGRILAYVGDANNMSPLAGQGGVCSRAWRSGSPPRPGYTFSGEELAALQAFADRAGAGRDRAARPTIPRQAAKGAAVLYTDVWTSMGQEDERAARLAAFEGFTIDEDAGRPGRLRRGRAALPAGAPG